jgi:hypothetical protein
MNPRDAIHAKKCVIGPKKKQAYAPTQSESTKRLVLRSGLSANVAQNASEIPAADALSSGLRRLLKRLDQHGSERVGHSLKPEVGGVRSIDRGLTIIAKLDGS